MTNYDDTVPSEPPPSYNDAVNDPPYTGNSTNSASRPDQYPRPPTRIQPGQPQLGPSNPSSSYSQTAPNLHNPGSNYARPNYSLYQRPSQPTPAWLDPHSLYTNNDLLPFLFPRGYFCNSCKNTGFKDNRGKPCSECWKLLFRDKRVYNPNPSLPFRYPERYLCEKCLNTGNKWKNGRLCHNCFERFAPRNNFSRIPSGSPFGSMTAFTTVGVPGFLRTEVIGPPAGIRVAPGDPRLGGVLCGRCRGTGLVTYFLDEELCQVCSGLGRIVNLPVQ